MTRAMVAVNNRSRRMRLLLRLGVASCFIGSQTLLAVVLLLVSGAANAVSGQERVFSIDDLFSLQSLAAVAPSPDGRMVAVVVQRAWDNPETFRPYSMGGFDHADIWLVDVESGKVDSVTDGSTDGSGYWNPVWSADGRTLAMLSTHGGDNVRLYALDVPSGRITRVTEQAADLQPDFGTPPWGNPMLNHVRNPVHWVDANRLLVTVLLRGEQPPVFRDLRQTVDRATSAWRAAHHGTTTTASVLDAEALPVPAPRQLLLVDLSNHTERVLVEGQVREVLVAPGGRWAMVTAVEDDAQGPERETHRVGVITFEEEPKVVWLDDVTESSVSLERGVAFGPGAREFSPNQPLLALLSRLPDGEAVTQMVELESLAVHRVAANVSGQGLAWVDGQLLVRGPARSGDARPDRERSDWWVAWNGEAGIGPDAPAKSLTAALPAEPTEIVRSASHGHILTVADGELWSIAAPDGEPTSLTGDLPEPVTGFVAQSRRSGSSRTFVVTTRDGSRRSYYHLDANTTSAELIPITVPAGSNVIAHDPAKGRVLAWAPNNARGSFLWTGTVREGATRRLLALNEHFAEVAPHRRLLIDYQGENGRPLQAVVMLPPRQDERALPPPAVFWVYPGHEVRDTVNSYWLSLNHQHLDNVNVLAGAGYAVVIPSMPLGPPPRENLLEQMTVGVLPLLDRLGELALVDTARVAVMGQSYGGYGVLALIGMTNRFRTAIARDGFANLTSWFGTFDARKRYTDTPHVGVVPRGLVANSVGFTSPPWQDPELYWRNSPLAHVSAVETPVLLIQGDLDFVPIQQSEEYFTALRWLGKPARFIRYWGEGHGPGAAAANARHYWSQVLEWLQRTMPPAPADPGENSTN